jgi:hypothetical protein
MERRTRGLAPVGGRYATGRAMRVDGRRSEGPLGRRRTPAGAPLTLIGPRVESHGQGSELHRRTGAARRSRETASMSIFRKKTTPRGPLLRHHGEDDGPRAWCWGPGVLGVVRTDPSGIARSPRLRSKRPRFTPAQIEASPMRAPRPWWRDGRVAVAAREAPRDPLTPCSNLGTRASW